MLIAFKIECYGWINTKKVECTPASNLGFKQLETWMKQSSPSPTCENIMLYAFFIFENSISFTTIENINILTIFPGE